MIFKFLEFLEKVFERPNSVNIVNKYPEQYFLPKFENTLSYSSDLPKETMKKMKMYFDLDLSLYKEKEIFGLNSVKFLKEMNLSDYVSWFSLYLNNNGNINNIKHVERLAFNNVGDEYRNLRDNKYLKAKEPFIVTPLHGTTYKIILMDSIAKDWPHNLGDNVILFSDGTISEGGENKLEIFSSMPRSIQRLIQ